MVDEFDPGVEEIADVPYHDIMELFETLTFSEKWAKIREGLKQPPESGEYKWAKLQMVRLWSPVSAVIVPIVALLLLAVLASLTPKRQNNVQVQIAEVETPEELEEPEDIPEPEIEPPDPEKIIEPTENFVPSTSDNNAAPDTDFSPQPAQFDSVAIVKSPVVMKGIFGSRSPGARGSALGRYGGGGHTEGAVLRALRWLKKNQESDGSWNGSSGGGQGKKHPVAMTGMALLTYLAHGETPASPEFGQTVEKAIKYLVEKAGTFPARYEHAIGTYALCEAFSMTKVPSIKAAATTTMNKIINGQNPTGGFRYTLTPADKSDNSCMGWAGQAMKAGKMAGLQNPGLDEAMKKLISSYKTDLFRAHHNDPSRGGFGYTGPAANHKLTGVGVLVMQLLGAQNEKECKAGLQELIAADTFKWEGASWKNVYYWYYNTQARFHEGGESWRAWNKQFSVPLVKGQNIIPNGIMGPAGKMVDIGFWETNNTHGGRVMDTALCALMLQVYYRYLPTFQKPEDIAKDAGGGEGGEKEGAGGVVAAKDLDIDVQL